MYGRAYEGQELSFEASGGLMNSALVLQDRETDTYWSIMTGEAVAGSLTGTPLDELPVSEKTRWSDWLRRHPDTLVLSIDGLEDLTEDPYDDYFGSEQGFRNQRASDERLDTKDPVYAFELGGTLYAVPLELAGGGRSFELDAGRAVFLFRPEGSPIMESTAAFVSSEGGFERRDGTWVHTPTGAEFDPITREFGHDAPVSGNAPPVDRLSGFDTFWYTWSLANPDSVILR